MEFQSDVVTSRIHIGILTAIAKKGTFVMAHPISRRHAVLTGLAALIAPLLPGSAQAQANSPIAGQYNARGRNPDGSEYSGIVHLTEMDGTVSMVWQVGSETYAGKGPRDGRIVTVDWGSDSPVVYLIMANGALHGTWANGLALEKLTPN